MHGGKLIVFASNTLSSISCRRRGGGGVLLDEAFDGGESGVDLLDAAGLLVGVGFNAALPSIPSD
jgi:hypothetical protein